MFVLSGRRGTTSCKCIRWGKGSVGGGFVCHGVCDVVGLVAVCEVYEDFLCSRVCVDGRCSWCGELFFLFFLV